MKKLKPSNDADDVYSILDSTLFSKTKKKILYDGFKKNKTINEVLDKPTTNHLWNDKIANSLLR